jgi:hypothetical protein
MMDQASPTQVACPVYGSDRTGPLPPKGDCDDSYKCKTGGVVFAVKNGWAHLGAASA